MLEDCNFRSQTSSQLVKYTRLVVSYSLGLGQLTMSDEHSEEEVRRYAAFLHLQLPEDEDLLWIAREGLNAPLPAPWTACRTSNDELFYYNFDTGESSWEHPSDEYYRKQYQAQKTRKVAEHSSPGETQSLRQQLATQEAAERSELLRLHQISLRQITEQNTGEDMKLKAEVLVHTQQHDAQELEAKLLQITQLQEEVERTRTRVAAIRSSTRSQQVSNQKTLANEKLQAEAALREEFAQKRAAIDLRLEHERRLAETVFQRTTNLQQASLTHSQTSLRWNETRMQTDIQERLAQAQSTAEAEFHAEKLLIEQDFQEKLKQLSVVPMQTLLESKLTQYRSQVDQATAQRCRLLDAETQSRLHAFEHHLAQLQEPAPSSAPVPDSKAQLLKQRLQQTSTEIESIDQELLQTLRRLVEARQHTPDSLEALRKLKELVMNPNLQA